MNQLLKYILIINTVFIVLFAIFTMTGLMYEDYKETKYTEEEIESIHAQGQLVPIPKGPLYILSQGLIYLFLYLLPIFIIFMSGLYQYKNPNLRVYVKSLLIPISYIFLAFFLTLLWGELIGISGEEGMAFMYFWAQFAITLFAVAIINFVIFLIKRN